MNTDTRRRLFQWAVQLGSGTGFLVVCYVWLGFLTQTIRSNPPSPYDFFPQLLAFISLSLLLILSSLARVQQRYWFIPWPAYVAAGCFTVPYSLFALIGILYALESPNVRAGGLWITLPSSLLLFGIFVLAGILVPLIRAITPSYRITVWVTACTLALVPLIHIAWALDAILSS